MKKILFTTTALVAATVITSAAYADGMASTRYSSSMKSSSMSSANQLQSTRYLQQNDMMGASAFKLKVGGYANWMVGYADNSTFNNPITSTVASTNEFDVMGDAQVHFDFSASLKNGIKLGAVSQLTTDTSVANAKIDQTYMYATSMYGKVMVGRHDNANKQLAIHAIDLGPLDIQDTELKRWIIDPMAFVAATNYSTQTANNVLSSTTFSLDDDATKITYITPNFSGFQAGATYAPKGDTTKTSVDVNVNSYDSANVTAVYNGAYNGVGFGFSGGYTKSKNNNNVSVDGFNVGASIEYKGFRVSGAYKDTEIKSSSQREDAIVWDIGVSYQTGPYGLSLSYLDYLVKNDVKDVIEGQTMLLSGIYNIAAGIDAFATIGWGDYSINTLNNKNDGIAIVSGMMLSF